MFSAPRPKSHAPSPETKIARRFLFSKASHSIVGLVARVSVAAVAVPVVALVVVMALHNGLSQTIENLYSQIDSPLQVRPVKGSTFVVDSFAKSQLGLVSETLEGQALARYGEQQLLVTVRGVDSLYGSVTGIEGTILRGEWLLEWGGMPRAVLGAGAAYALNYSLAAGAPLELYAFRPTPVVLSFLPVPLYVARKVVAGGVFAVDQTTDAAMVFVPIGLARELFGAADNEVSTLELSQATTKQQVVEWMGDRVSVLTKNEQRAEMYRVMNLERWVIMLLLGGVALVGAMSLVGCMLMMISDKERGIAVLETLGMTRQKVRGVFVWLGMWIVGLGVGIGVVVGVGLVAAQGAWGFLKLGGESMLLDAYPVQLLPIDLLVTVVGVGVIGYLVVRTTVYGVMRSATGQKID